MKRNLMALFFALSLAAGFPLVAMGGPVPTGVDADSDGVDDAVDSCLGLANSGQADVDHDGCGDPCDTICDPNANGTVDIADISGAAGNFNSTTALNFDCNDNGTVDIADITGLAGSFNATTGPSGLDSALKTSGVPMDGGNGLNCP